MKTIFCSKTTKCYIPIRLHFKGSFAIVKLSNETLCVVAKSVIYERSSSSSCALCVLYECVCVVVQCDVQ
jgi:hypothetical protein